MAVAQSDALPFDNQRPLHQPPGVDLLANSVTDSELLIRRAFGENPLKGYELLFKRHYGPLCSHAVRFVYDRQAAEDIVIDTFAQFWQKRLDLVVTTSFRAYLYTMVRHRAFAYVRKEFSGESNAEVMPPDESAALPTPLELLQYNELQLIIDETIRSESPQSQKVFVMSRFEGKKNPQIADELGLSVKTVEGHITKMLSVLRRVLRHDGLISVGAIMGYWLIGLGISGIGEAIQQTM